MNRTFRHPLTLSLMRGGLLFLCFLLPCCFDFGSREERLSPNVTSQDIDQISRITGITLPPGTTGLAYFYDASGLDPVMAAKVMIPVGKIAEVLDSEIFTKGEFAKMIQGPGPGRSWWKPDTMTDRKSRTMTIKGKQFLGCILGKDGSNDILYISWFDT